MLPWWYERWEAPTRHVRAGFGSDVCDEVGVTYISIVIFFILPLGSDANRSIDLGDLTTSP